MDLNVDISGSFKVGSWLLSVDTYNREGLLKSCQNWTEEHSSLLSKEIEEQLFGKSLLGIQLVRTTKQKLVYASLMLEKYKNFPYTPITIGLNLIP